MSKHTYTHTHTNTQAHTHTSSHFLLWHKHSHLDTLFSMQKHVLSLSRNLTLFLSQFLNISSLHLQFLIRTTCVSDTHSS